MVFHLFETIFSPNNYTYNLADTQGLAYAAEGFSQKEAQQLAWISAHNEKGKLWGTVFGVYMAYAWGPWVGKLARHFPRLYFQSWAANLARIGTVIVFYQLGDYIYTSRRWSANQKLSNPLMTGNRRYIDSKESFLQNFEPLNRKFTSDEITQFLANQVTWNSFERKWIYNPYLHGDSEQTWRKEYVERYFTHKQAPWQADDIQKKIKDENQSKIDSGEIIQYSPFKVINHIDHLGKRFGLAQSPFTTQWTIVE